MDDAGIRVSRLSLCLGAQIQFLTSSNFQVGCKNVLNRRKDGQIA